jgi:hypothetical protein
MKTSFDRRAVLFLIFAIICFSLIPLAPTEFQFVGELLTGTYVVLAVLSWLDYVSLRTFRKRSK